MQTCDSTCHWCARSWFGWLRDRMKSSQRVKGRSGEGSFADAAATSVVGAGSLDGVKPGFAAALEVAP